MQSFAQSSPVLTPKKCRTGRIVLINALWVERSVEKLLNSERRKYILRINETIVINNANDAKWFILVFRVYIRLFIHSTLEHWMNKLSIFVPYTTPINCFASYEKWNRVMLMDNVIIITFSQGRFYFLFLLRPQDIVKGLAIHNILIV